MFKRRGWLGIMVGLIVIRASGQTTAFSLQSSTPAANATDVPLMTTVMLVFDDILDDASIFVVIGSRGRLAGTFDFPQSFGNKPSASRLPIPLMPPRLTRWIFQGCANVNGVPPTGITRFRFTTQSGMNSPPSRHPWFGFRCANGSVPLTSFATKAT